MVIKKKLVLILFLIIGTLIQIIPVIRSGWQYSFGIGFWGPSGHDSVWHLSLINHINNPFKINMPVYSGEYLKNYHPLFDVLISYLSKITFLPSSIWLFQIYPILSSIIFLYLSFLLGKLLTKNFWGGIFLLLINSLANSFGWLVSYIRYGNFSGESLFWAMQSPSNQINQPYSLSLIFILLLLIILYQNYPPKPLSLLYSTTVFIILILLPITKAYSAVVGFGIFSLYTFKSFQVKRHFKNIFILIFSLVCSYYLFSIYNPSSSGLLIYKPLWFVNSMIDSVDKLFIPKISSYRIYLESLSAFDLRLIPVYLITFIIFIVGNFSWRLLGIFHLLKSNNFLDKSIFFLIIVLIAIPSLFIQKSTSWNTIQFLYYGLFLSNLFLTSFLLSIFKNKIGKFVVIFIFTTYIIAFLGMLSNYFGGKPPASLPLFEIQALKFLEKQPSGTVLTVPYDEYLKQHFPSTPIPLYAYETTSYVSAYSRHLTYLEDEMNTKNSGYDNISRRNQSLEFFQQQNIYKNRGFLVNNQIDYIYLTGLQINLFPLNTQDMYLIPIYNTTDVIIYRVQR